MTYSSVRLFSWYTDLGGQDTLPCGCSVLLLSKHKKLVGSPRLCSITGRQGSEAGWFPLGFTGTGRWLAEKLESSHGSWDDFREGCTF